MKLPSLIGVIHLPPLPGSPGAMREEGEDPALILQRAGLWAVREAKLLTQAGFDGLILENFGDVPFYANRVPPETISSMAVIAAAVRETTRLPVGINILRNDARAAVAVASVTGCDFIRVNVLSGVAATDQGLIQGDAAGVLREKLRLGARGVGVLADVHVKHSRSLSSEDVAQAAEDLALRSGADGVIVTGAGTGKGVDLVQLQKVSEALRPHSVPVYIGSGATVQNLDELRRWADGIIVGSALRKAGRAGAPLDLKRIKDFVRAFRKKKKASRKKKR